MSTNKIIELAKKINELAKRGIDGEKEAASDALVRIMMKHGLSMEDIESEEQIARGYNYKTNLEKQLIAQVASSVRLSPRCYTRHGQGGTLWVQATEAEHIEIEFKYEVYRRLMKKEIEIFYAAFLQQNNIFHPEGRKRSTTEMSEKERAEARRILEMSESIERANLRKQIKTATP